MMVMILSCDSLITFFDYLPAVRQFKFYQCECPSGYAKGKPIYKNIKTSWRISSLDHDRKRCIYIDDYASMSTLISQPVFVGNSESALWKFCDIQLLFILTFDLGIIFLVQTSVNFVIICPIFLGFQLIPRRWSKVNVRFAMVKYVPYHHFQSNKYYYSIDSFFVNWAHTSLIKRSSSVGRPFRSFHIDSAACCILLVFGNTNLFALLKATKKLSQVRPDIF